MLVKSTVSKPSAATQNALSPTVLFFIQISSSSRMIAKKTKVLADITTFLHQKLKNIISGKSAKLETEAGELYIQAWSPCMQSCRLLAL